MEELTPPTYSALRRRPTFSLFLLHLLILMLPQRSAAQDDAHAPSRWSVQVAPGSVCGFAPGFVDQLEAAIPSAQRAPASNADVIAIVHISDAGVGRVHVVDASTRKQIGQREVTLPSTQCDKAADALGLVLGVLVEAGRAVLLEETERKQNSAAEPNEDGKQQGTEGQDSNPAQQDPETAEEPDAPRRARSRRQRHAWLGPPPGVDLELGAGTGVGLLPDFALGGTAGLGIRWHRIWPIWWHARGFLGELSSDGKANLGAAFLSVSTCPLHWEGPHARLRLCPALSLGGVWAAGRGFARSDKKVEHLEMLGLQAAAHIKLWGPLELVVDARVDLPFSRLRFVYNREDGAQPTIHDTAVVNGGLFGALGLRFR